jgi:hypothetical protein
MNMVKTFLRIRLCEQIGAKQLLHWDLVDACIRKEGKFPVENHSNLTHFEGMQSELPLETEDVAQAEESRFFYRGRNQISCALGREKRKQAGGRGGEGAKIGGPKTSRA